MILNFGGFYTQHDNETDYGIRNKDAAETDRNIRTVSKPRDTGGTSDRFLPPPPQNHIIIHTHSKHIFSYELLL